MKPATDPSWGAPVDLAASQARLAPLVRALFDRAPALLPMPAHAPGERPFLSNLGVHLPASGDSADGPLTRGWYDAAATHAGAHLQHTVHLHARGHLKPIQTSLVGLLEDARVELLAVAEMPGLRRLWLAFHRADSTQGDTFTALMARLARGLLDPAHIDPHPWVAKGRRLFSEATEGGHRPEALSPAALREIASRLGNDIGQMRLPFNAREYRVEPSYRDDNACIWEPLEARQPEWLQGDDAPPSAAGDLRLETIAEAEAAAGAAVRTYPEWDRLIGDYRPAWCSVLEDRPRAADPGALHAALDRHGAQFRRVERLLRAGRRRERVTLRAQWRGDEIDLDAAIRATVERRTHHTPDPKLLQRVDRRERAVATLLLLDSSASSADRLPGRDGSVLDLARQAAVLTTRTLAAAGDRCAIHAFASNGRHAVHYQRALDFDEPLDDHALARLAGVQSRWSTRMGAALRHASGILADQPQRDRLLLFVTDGEPHDIDIHDRRYLIEDARRAVLEAGRMGITVFCVSLDPAADGCVRDIFGVRRSRVLDHLDALPRVLPDLVLRLTR